MTRGEKTMEHQKYFDDVLSSFVGWCFPKQVKKEEDKSEKPERTLRSQSGVLDQKLLNLYKAIDLAG